MVATGGIASRSAAAGQGPFNGNLQTTTSLIGDTSLQILGNKAGILPGPPYPDMPDAT